ncbi:MAG: polymer-forming cytoskeletal protein [Steroidobacteraceae bacterium]|jgi:cytoskeletal protein CcmA (bactofilin family)|nr:polymer-forming cytoskeletal protein [Steroidobacteraceae bacterium]
MFKRKPKVESSQVETLVGAGTRVEGNVQIGGGMHLEGYVKGNVTGAPEAATWLAIAEKGTVEGLVDVPRVVVHGEVKGDIRARDKVQFGPTARVSGNVLYGTIEMAAGAVIQGRLMAVAGGAQSAEPAERGGGGGERGGLSGPATVEPAG